MTKHDGDWTVWGDREEPYMTGTEVECKKYVEAHPELAEELYVSDPKGNEHELTNGKWSPE